MGDAIKVAFHLDRHGFDDRQPERPPNGFEATGGLHAMELQQVGLQSFDDSGEESFVGIDGKRHFERATAHARAERSCGVERYMPRRRRKEHEAYHVGAGVERRVEGLRRRQPADFDQ